ncbi:decaprenyl-diphosphate synthase subunit 1-like isoform X1 [Mizuhopecten yessoensis]|uniref:All trans-polyprenyl-diphosphate synthase PDSS1 n=1 Tax=Mizuhopecten yessoensis TaxID=6573 RepID=A0A210QBG2_MIZYE|nr:decaprenyl-diphosphate synthase subunit 1-like isoform X1 [Mizuhopecten yessoensis]OWF46055.1 Decaprenyl-diphosphate synthase subunit 1 [Mizuhopecten yessoensis]
MASVSSRLQSELLKCCRFRQSLKKCLSMNINIIQTRRLASFQNGFTADILQRNPLLVCVCGNKIQSREVRLFSDSALSDNIGRRGDNPASVSPFGLVEPELDELCSNIKQKLTPQNKELADITQYYFDGKGKAFRPMLVMLMAKAINVHMKKSASLLESQKEVSMIAEMIHTASLIHDDVIDASDTRRGKPTVDTLWGQRKAILAGDYILSVASVAIAKIRNEEVVYILARVIEDLVRGEFMQLGSKEDENARFNHYLKKTFKKTASLIANTCKAVAVLAECPDDVVEIAFQYGRNIGVAFQLIDDLLDFTSCDHVMGKPTAADLRLGLATAPVLFATNHHPELNSMIMRRFSMEGDVERARKMVANSNGVEQTRVLAEEHSKEAMYQLSHLAPSVFRESLGNVANAVLTRTK